MGLMWILAARASKHQAGQESGGALHGVMLSPQPFNLQSGTLHVRHSSGLLLRNLN